MTIKVVIYIYMCVGIYIYIYIIKGKNTNGTIESNHWTFRRVIEDLTMDTRISPRLKPIHMLFYPAGYKQPPRNFHGIFVVTLFTHWGPLLYTAYELVFFQEDVSAPSTL